MLADWLTGYNWEMTTNSESSFLFLSHGIDVERGLHRPNQIWRVIAGNFAVLVAELNARKRRGWAVKMNNEFVVTIVIRLLWGYDGQVGRFKRWIFNSWQNPQRFNYNGNHPTGRQVELSCVDERQLAWGTAFSCRLEFILEKPLVDEVDWQERASRRRMERRSRREANELDDETTGWQDTLALNAWA